MLWRLDGSDKDTGKTRAYFIEADSREEAEGSREGRSLINLSCGRATPDERARWEKTQNAVPRLINCPVCARQVSNQAPACPSCGHPIAKQTVIPAYESSPAAKLTPPTMPAATVEKTSLQMKLATIICILGTIMAVAGMLRDIRPLMLVGFIVLLIGLLWAIAA